MKSNSFLLCGFFQTRCFTIESKEGNICVGSRSIGFYQDYLSLYPYINTYILVCKVTDLTRLEVTENIKTAYCVFMNYY